MFLYGMWILAVEVTFSRRITLFCTKLRYFWALWVDGLWAEV